MESKLNDIEQAIAWKEQTLTTQLMELGYSSIDQFLEANKESLA